MKKPPYNLEALRRAVKVHDANIARFNEATQKEMELKAEVMGYIKQWEAYNLEHGSTMETASP